MATLKDVARAAGFGLGTVSRALSGHPDVAPSTRKRIEEIAKSMGYRPNGLARALRNNSSKVVGLVIPDLENSFYTSGAARMQEVLAQQGYQLLVCCSDNDAEVDAALLHSLLERRVDAIAHVPCTPEGAAVVREAAPAIPIVEYARRSELEGVDSVVGDETFGSQLVVERLLSAGHRRIAMIAGPVHLSTTRARLAGFRTALSLADIPAGDCPVVHGGYRPETGAALVQEVLRSHPDVTAIFSSSSTIVLGAMRALDEMGLRIPQDLSMVGFLNPPWYDVLATPITTYELPLVDMGAMAADLLLRRMLEAPDDRQPPRSVQLRGRVVDRHSVGTPRTRSRIVVPPRADSFAASSM